MYTLPRLKNDSNIQENYLILNTCCTCNFTNHIIDTFAVCERAGRFQKALKNLPQKKMMPENDYVLVSFYIM